MSGHTRIVVVPLGVLLAATHESATIDRYMREHHPRVYKEYDSSRVNGDEELSTGEHER